MIYIRQGGDDQRSAMEITTTRKLLLKAMSESSVKHENTRNLQFELRMREATLSAAIALNSSGANFADFDHSFCNPEFWIREPNGAFRLRGDRRPADALRDIFHNGSMYGFECATAIVIVFYKAALDTIGDAAYDRLFANTYLFHWNVDQDLGLTTIPTDRFIPGDCLYFDNPDVNVATMEWQGENVIFMRTDTYYGHGIGIRSGADIIAALNAHRRPGATRSAYLLRQATRPNYARLSQLAGVRPGGSQSPEFTGLPGGAAMRARIGQSVYMDYQ